MGEKMIKSEINIKMDIKSYMDRFGGDYKQWSVGVTHCEDPRLLEMSHARKHGKQWIFNTASNNSIAKYVFRYLLNLGAQAEELTNMDQAKVIYAYKKSL